MAAKEQAGYEIIRVATEAEYAVIGTLFRAYQQELGKDLSFQDFDQELRGLDKKYNAANGALLLLKDLADEAYVGCVGLKQLDPDNCEMKRLYVEPAYRAKKYGARLVQAILEAAIELGYQEIWLDTLQELVPAIKLYEKFGFSQTAPYYHNPYDEVVFMRKKLA